MSVRAIHLCLAALLSACASFEPPAPFDQARLRERSVSAERDGFRSSATLLTEAEIEATFGMDLLAKGIEPVWLEIENRSAHPVLLLVSAIDPEYFAPLEVAHAFRTRSSKEGNERRGRFLSELAFPNRPALEPGSTTSGFVFISESAPTQMIDLDLLGEEFTVNMTLFAPNPRIEGAGDLMDRFEDRFSPPELIHIEDEPQLRAALEGLPCCARDAAGAHVAPLNLVLIGEFPQWASGLLRRGYRQGDVAEMYAFQRVQDIAGVKSARWVEAQSHRIRCWQTPLRYRSVPVWLAQVSTPRGGRFAEDPDLVERSTDRARDDALMDIVYCQNLTRFAFVTGAGCSVSRAAGAETDGLRTLMVFEERSVGLEEVEFLQWERPGDPR